MKRIQMIVAGLAVAAVGITGCRNEVRVVSERPRERAVVVVEERPHDVIVVREDPPPLRVERMPPPPSREHVWIGGYYTYSDHRYVWVAGRYAVPPRAGAHWEPDRWERGDDGHHYVPGRWR